MTTETTKLLVGRPNSPARNSVVCFAPGRTRGTECLNVNSEDRAGAMLKIARMCFRLGWENVEVEFAADRD